jgi:PIN domain nuclease of toxin-antitoxin system
MKLLLDAHVLIWFTEGNDRLSVKARIEIEKPINIKFLSVASLWEIVIKASKEKLELKQSFAEINDFLLINNIQIIGVEIRHLNILLNLPHHHGDPFDRLIISQAITENLTVISADQHFKNYPIPTIW